MQHFPQILGNLVKPGAFPNILKYKGPTTGGSFGVGQVTANQDIRFTNTGTLLGSVRRASGEVVSQGTVTVTGTMKADTAFTGLADAGYSMDAESVEIRKE